MPHPAAGRLALLALLLAIPVAAPAPAQTPASAPAIPQLTPAQWREDLRFMAAELERRHANLFHSVSRERFAAALAGLDARIPHLRRNEIIVGMMRLAAMVGDGHTRVEPLKDLAFGFPSLPLKLYLFEDGLYVRAARPEQADLLGARIEAIGGVPVEEAIRRAAEIASRDNAIGPKLYVPLYLAMPDILHALKLSDATGAATFRLRKGKRRWTVAIPAGEVEPSWPPDTDISLVTPEGWVDSRTTRSPPLWLQDPLDYHRLVELPDRGAVYAQLNMVTDKPGQPLGAFGALIRERAEAMKARAIILDLRLDRGGGGHLRNRFVRELIKAQDEDTRLFVLTWRGTFSASQFILDDLDRLTEAVFIGEPASSKPSSYGDGYRIVMPNSGISVRMSLMWWQDGQNKSPWTPVDIAAPLAFADYSAGRDPALEAALNYEPRPSIQQQLLAGAKAGGAAGAAGALAAYRADVANRYFDLEKELPKAGERISLAGEPEAGLIVAQLTAKEYPRSVDAWNVLASVAERLKRPEIAVPAARRTLELDPNNRFAQSVLQRLEPAGAPQ
jgi:hypothetical protein